MSKIIITTLLALVLAPSAIAEDNVNYKFPIIEQQFPDLQKTVKAPTVVWQTRKEEENRGVTNDNQNHIISPLFYYQVIVKKAN